MKILIHSNGPQLKTGYGVQAALLALRLKAAGHDVAISAFCGQTGTGMWNGIPVYPGGADPVGNDMLPEHALHHFGGDPHGGWILTLLDVFGITNPALKDFNVAAWCPIDHFPTPPDVVKFFAWSGAVPIAMSKWGRDLMEQSGLAPLYAPLVIDPDIYRPTPEVLPGVSFRELIEVDEDAFLVTMNGMNKMGVIDRKGFSQAFSAFGELARNHPNAVLYMHTEKTGYFHQGRNLMRLADNAGIPADQIRWVDQYAYRLGDIPGSYLAAAYTASDLLLAPSHGEGFCVPLIEAQACGCPVLVSDFSAQPELVGAGWKVPVTPYEDPTQGAYVAAPDLPKLADALEDAYQTLTATPEPFRLEAVEFTTSYEADKVFAEHWVPILAELEGEPVELDRPKMGGLGSVAVLVPALNRPANVAPLVESFTAAAQADASMGDANLYFVCDADDEDEIRAVKDAGANVLISDRGSTWAQKVNSGFAQTLEPWVLLVGDDVRFHKGYIAAARKLSDRFDVIGTNDHPKGKGNQRVANGSHADHVFVRRSYVDTYGACLGGGTVCFEGYRHFYSDVELVELAKARKVFTPCLESLVEHLHPDLGLAEVDDTYRAGWSAREADQKLYDERAPLIAMQRRGMGK